MKTIEDEVIGKLRYLTIEFDQTELLAGHIGIISQGAVRRYFEGECPDLKVMKCGGLKLDSQRNIVTMRFGVVNKPDIEAQKFVTSLMDMHKAVGNIDHAPIDQKFLNPGYDEILLENKKLKEKYDYLIEKYQITGNKLSEVYKKYDVLQHEKDIVGRLYDALVAAVSKDAQKFSDLLVENEQLKIDLMMYMKTDEPTAFDPEDAVDLADAKEVIESADSVPLSKIELTGTDGAKIEGEKAEGGVRGDRHKEIVVADISLSEESENV